MKIANQNVEGFGGKKNSDRIKAAQKRDWWMKTERDKRKQKQRCFKDVCVSVNTLKSRAKDNPCNTLQFNTGKKQSRFYLCVHTHIFKGTNTHPNEWVKCFSPKQRWLQYMGNTPTTFPFPPTVIFFLSARSLSLLYIPSSMFSYNNAVMTEIIHFTTPP